MTKQNEIEILRECAEKLGKDSYCQQWLLDQIPYIENDMRADLFPQLGLAETRRMEQNTLTLAKEQAERIVAQARTEAETVRKHASQWSKSLRISAISALEKAIKDIGEI